jgi:hypothetical protein
MLRGKGLWAYRDWELDRALLLAPQMGATHILYKVGHAGEYLPGMEDVVARVLGAGLVPLAWTALYLEDPRAEANVVLRALDDGFEGLVFDTEVAQCRNRFEEAALLGDQLRGAGVDPARLFNCSYPNISHHRDLPYDRMNSYCRGGLMPMSYGTFYSRGSPVPPEQQAQRVIDELTYDQYEYWCRRWGYRPPIYPVLAPYHDVHGQERMSPEEFQAWLDRLAAHHPTFFSVYTAGVVAENLLPLIYTAPLGQAPAGPKAQSQVQVSTPDGSALNVRPTPSTRYRPVTQVALATTLDALEPPESVAAKAGREGEWLHIRTPEGVEGFVAAWYVAQCAQEATEARLQAVVFNPESGFASIRPAPVAFLPPIGRLEHRSIVDVLEPHDVATAKLATEDQWLRVRSERELHGYVSTSHLRPHQSLPSLPLRLIGADAEGDALALRPSPSDAHSAIGTVEVDAMIESLEPEDEVRAKAGQDGKWIRVRTGDGRQGFVAASQVRIVEPPGTRVAGVVVFYPGRGHLQIQPYPCEFEFPAVVARVKDGTLLETLEADDDVREKVGKPGLWLRVRTPDGATGLVKALYAHLHEERLPQQPLPQPAAAEPSTPVEVIDIDGQPAPIRRAPDLAELTVTLVEPGTLLEATEKQDFVLDQVGHRGKWLRVRTPDGVEGYIHAESLRLREQAVGEKVSQVVVRSMAGLNIRKSPSTADPPIWKVPDGTVLDVCEDVGNVRERIGKDGWLRVGTPSLHEGYVSSLYVQAKQFEDERKPVEDATLPRGECAWIYGIHASEGTEAGFRFLFEGTKKTGWVLFTQSLGANRDVCVSNDYSGWSDDGYGVIVRLNHGYEGRGTLPPKSKYGDFAFVCGAYAAQSKGCHVWIIGNEQNNVREHPAGDPIHPEAYAEAFNLARAAIKAAQPEAIVVPGSVDPYFGLAWSAGGPRYSPLDYFRKMLEYIDDLDGIALHTYTHWMDTKLITARTFFTDAFLQPGTPKEHYYDFLSYRAFAEAIPERWRDRPIYITETNHWLALERQPRSDRETKLAGWVNKDKGWVQAAYAEIDRWNKAPHAQQIHCLLLYRWSHDDWAIEDKRNIHKDFRKALEGDYRWRA